MANRKIGVALFISFILIAGLIYWKNLPVEPKPVIDSEAPQAEASADIPDFVKVTHTPSEMKGDSGVSFNDQDQQDLRSWYKDSVYHGDYASYDEETLLELANAGDVMAMKTLALKRSDPNRLNAIKDADAFVAHVNKTGELIEKAIIYGDREFLDMNHKLSNATGRFTSPNSTPEEKHQGMIDALAYAEFIGLRGDLGEKYYRQMSFFEIYKEWGTPDTLTEQEKQAIRQRAREIYDSYEQKRIELGLGPFDNSVSEGKAKEFEIEKQKYLEKMGDKAI